MTTGQSNGRPNVPRAARRGIPFRFYFGLLFALVVCSAAVSVVYLQAQSSYDARSQAHTDAAYAGSGSRPAA